jgi:uncharacterized repeat protein (TIGR03803 family)
MTFLVVLALAALAPAQTFTTLHSFPNGLGGGLPYAGLTKDPAGNLYGTTYYGGVSGGGVVFKVDTSGTESVLYSFCTQEYCADGSGPVAPVVRDKAGNIYGTTYFGGTNCNNGCGTVFEIDIARNETVLHTFGYSDGCYPSQGLVMDISGALFGTTSGYDCSDNGNIFTVDSAGIFKILHSFAGPPSDGAYPNYGNLAMDKSGNLYGLTAEGGAHNWGALYELSKSGTFTLLHSFMPGTSDGCDPEGSVVRDIYGNLYGTTNGCGSTGNGTIWKVGKKGKETILHNFAGGSSDGCYPYGGVARDTKGNLYGVTYGCGANGYGALYKLNTSGRLTLLHSFDYSDGILPIGEVLRNGEGTLYGTTYMGGTYGYGTVWSYKPLRNPGSRDLVSRRRRPISASKSRVNCR